MNTDSDALKFEKGKNVYSEILTRIGNWDWSKVDANDFGRTMKLRLTWWVWSLNNRRLDWTSDTQLDTLHSVPFFHVPSSHHIIIKWSNLPKGISWWHLIPSRTQRDDEEQTHPVFLFPHKYSHNITRLALPHLRHLGFKFTNSFCFNLMHYHERRRVLFIFVFPTNFLISYLL
jgi:hypothetical protein